MVELPDTGVAVQAGDHAEGDTALPEPVDLLGGNLRHRDEPVARLPKMLIVVEGALTGSG